MTETPAEILANYPVLTIGQAAIVLRKLTRNGEPNRRAVRDLVRSGRLPLIDCSEPPHRWTVAAADVQRYINRGVAS